MSVFLNTLSCANRVIVKNSTRSNMLKGKWKTKDLNFIFTDISVSFLRLYWKEQKYQ